MACGPCRMAKIVKEAKKNRSLKGAAAGCDECKKGMARMEQENPRLARLVKPAHNYLTKKRTIGK